MPAFTSFKEPSADRRWRTRWQGYRKPNPLSVKPMIWEDDNEGIRVYPSVEAGIKKLYKRVFTPPWPHEMAETETKASISANEKTEVRTSVASLKRKFSAYAAEQVFDFAARKARKGLFAYSPYSEFNPWLN